MPANGLDPQAIDDLPRRGVNLKVSFPDANRNARIEPFNRLDTKVSYFIGNDSSKWQTYVPVWGGVRYVDFYPGVDLEITGQDGRLLVRHNRGQETSLNATQAQQNRVPVPLSPSPLLCYESLRRLVQS